MLPTKGTRGTIFFKYKFQQREIRVQLNPLPSHKVTQRRPESENRCYNGGTSQTIENKGGTRPWLIILPSFLRSSESYRDMNSRTWLGAIIGAASCGV